MGWARLDDRRHTNAKLRRAGLEAAGLDAHAITYCSANETDGFIDEAVVEMLASVRHWRKIADLLASNRIGRWQRDDELEGWWIINYLEFNPSRADLESKRTSDRIRKESTRTPKGTFAESAPPHPDPSRPIPNKPPNPHGAFVDKFVDAWIRHSESNEGIKSKTALRAWVLKTWGPWAKERFEQNPQYRPEQLVDKAKQLGTPPQEKVT